MISYTALYGLFALMSFVSLNALLLLARYSRQIKLPPSDADFDALLKDKQTLATDLEKLDFEKNELKAQIHQLELERKKMETELATRNKDFETLKRTNIDGSLSGKPLES